MKLENMASAKSLANTIESINKTLSSFADGRMLTMVSFSRGARNEDISFHKPELMKLLEKAAIAYLVEQRENLIAELELL